MPQHKPLMSLYELCIRQAQVLIKTSSENIGKKYGDYGNPRTTLAIEEVQQHLLSVVDGFYIDKIFNTYRGRFLHSLEYTAIYFSICLHANMKHMTLPNDFVSWKPYEEETDAKLEMFVADFWKANLPQLTQLERLNLCKFCNDSVLQVVGEYCLKLEIIEVDFDVSAQGIKYLLNCKELREINATNVENTYMTAFVAGLLLPSLPKLEKVFCCFLGAAIASLDEMTSLRLVSITEMEATPQHIHAIARLCPNVKAFKLANYDYDENIDNPAALTALAESDMKVPVLELFKFSFGPEVKSLLSHKGIFLTKLNVNQRRDNKMSLPLSYINVIGDTCPNLKSLSIHAHNIKNDAEMTASTNPVFTQLESLTITCDYWNYAVLDVILANALKIKDLSLLSEMYMHDYEVDENDMEIIVYIAWTTPLDVELAKLLMINPMADLRTLALSNAASEITMPTLDELLVSCPKLRFIVLADCGIYHSDGFKILYKRIKEQNLNLYFPIADVYYESIGEIF